MNNITVFMIGHVTKEGNIAGEEAKLLTKGQKFVAFFVNAPMIISFVIIGLLTAQYVSK